MTTAISEPEPITTALSFPAGGEAIITTVGRTTTVNWSASVQPQVFAGVVRGILDLSGAVAVTVQNAGEPMPDWEPGQEPEEELGEFPLDVSALPLDDSVRLVRIDLSESKSVAWQRVDPNTVFVGLGMNTLDIDLEEVQLFMEKTGDSSVDIDRTLEVVGEEMAVARGDAERPSEAGGSSVPEAEL